MARLTAAKRKKLKPSQFALPPKGYPVDTLARARYAKGASTTEVKKGDMSPATKKKIDAKANKALKAKGAKTITVKGKAKAVKPKAKRKPAKRGY